MSFGVYVHIPYCVQRCSYCDFTTFEQNQIMPPEKYVDLLLKEIENTGPKIPERCIHTLYFGGGTPSLIPAEDIVSVIKSLANEGGFSFAPNCEITLEINPATVDQHKLDLYLEAGVNRFSVGAQSFNDQLLKTCGRIHTAQDTRDTLKLLEKHKLNYSFDLLFALPGQNIVQLKDDLDTALEHNMNHISAYCLTVPSGHPMASGRAPEGEQIKMFQIIEETLKSSGFLKYEISNFSKPGWESQHNSLYWNDSSYWGIGLSSHSYFHSGPNWPFGVRFWNSKSFKKYEDQLILGEPFNTVMNQFSSESPFVEILSLNEAATDFCHIHLRTRAGLPEVKLQKKFGSTGVKIVDRLSQLTCCKYLNFDNGHWQLTPKGEVMSNQVFSDLTFLNNEL